MNTRVGLSFRPKACLRCGGDAYLSRGDDLDWVCLQCGRVVPHAHAMVRVPAQAETLTATPSGKAA
jgi:hypothetical protein